MMTAHRYNELKTMPLDVRTAAFVNEEEVKDFLCTAQWEVRSANSKRAVQTKRNKFSTWPTRKGDHKIRPSWNRWNEKREFDIQAD